MYDIILHSKLIVEAFVTTYGGYCALGFTAMLGTKWLALHKKDIQFVQAALQLAHFGLKTLLGDRGESIFQILLAGLSKAESGGFTNSDMVAEFIAFIKLRASEQNVVLSDTELAAIMPIVTSALRLFAAKPQAITAVVKNMQVE